MPGAILPIVGTPGEAERVEDEEEDGEDERTEGDETEEEESLRPGLPLIGIGDELEASGSSLSTPSLEAFSTSSNDHGCLVVCLFSLWFVKESVILSFFVGMCVWG